MAWQPSPYGDPYIGAALSNLAQLFAPPDPRELAALSQMGIAQSEEERKQAAVDAAKQLFGAQGGALAGGYASLSGLPEALLYSQASHLPPGASPRDIDLLSYAVHGDAGNTFEGHDALMANNLDVQGSRNAGALAVQYAQDDGAMARLMNSPIITAEGASAHLPPALASLYGNDTLMGNVAAGQNETIYGADGSQFGGLINVGKDQTTFGQDGQVYSGPTSPLSETEVKGGWLQQNPDVLGATMTSQIPLEQTVDENGMPVYTPRDQAAGAGAPIAASDLVKVMDDDGQATYMTANAAAAQGRQPLPEDGDLAAGVGPDGSSNEAWAWRIWLDPNATPDVLAVAQSILTTPKFVQVQENGQVVTKSVTFNLPPAASAAAASLPPVPVDPSAPTAAPPVAAPGPASAAPAGGFSVEPIPGTESHAPLTESQAKANMYATRMAEANDGLNALAASGFNAPTWATSQFHGQMPDMANMVIDDKSRQWFTLTEQFLNPILRGDSGAAVPEAEYPRYYAQFIPKAGDDAGTLALKTRARELAVEAMRIAAGGTYGSTTERDRAVAAAALEAGLRVGDLSTDGAPPPVGAPATAPPGPGAGITPEGVMQMSVEQLQQIGEMDITTLSPEVLQAAADRWKQLTEGQ